MAEWGDSDVEIIDIGDRIILKVVHRPKVALHFVYNI